MFSKIKQFIPLAIIITAFCLLVYLAVQQDIRQSANDPQIQLSEDSARALENGAKVEEVVSKTEVDISKSLSPFIIIFNDRQEPVNSQAVLNGKIPNPPGGVFDFVRAHNKEWFTWEPKPGVRIAAVVTKYNGANPGFVLAGRSIREVENREGWLGRYVGAAWVTTLIASFFAILIFGR